MEIDGAARFGIAALIVALPLGGSCVHRPLPLRGSDEGTGGVTGTGSGSGGAGALGAGGSGMPGAGGALVDLSPPPPRLIAPLSTATVTSQLPRLHYALAPDTDGAHIEVCSDRACGQVVASFDAGGSSVRSPLALPPGTVYWRAFGTRAGVRGSRPSPTWRMTVPVRTAPVDSSWGTIVEVTGDRYADAIVGAGAAGSGKGQAYVFVGGINGLGMAKALSGQGAQDNFGTAVAGAGDINGDGFADLVIGAPGAASLSGQVHVYPTGPDGLGPAVTIESTAGSISAFGTALASAGDVNGDGFADVIVGAATASGGTGRVDLFLGGADGLSRAPALSLTGPDGPLGLFGFSVAGAGDVNGDGFADVVVSAPDAEVPVAGGGSRSGGRVYLYLGGAGGLSSVPAVRLSPIVGTTAPRFGLCVTGAGDVNGDGFADVAVGVPGHAETHVFYGGVVGLFQPPAALLVSPNPSAASFGSALALGDTNRDGFADLIVGDPSGSSPGLVYVYLGSAAGLPGVPSLTLSGLDAGAQFGIAVAYAGDVNDDGYGDILVGANNFAGGIGRAYLHRGTAMGPSSMADRSLDPLTSDRGGFGSVLASIRRGVSRAQHANRSL